jgi:hypothetical protein
VHTRMRSSSAGGQRAWKPQGPPHQCLGQRDVGWQRAPQVDVAILIGCPCSRSQSGQSRQPSAHLRGDCSGRDGRLPPHVCTEQQAKFQHPSESTRQRRGPQCITDHHHVSIPQPPNATQQPGATEKGAGERHGLSRQDHHRCHIEASLTTKNRLMRPTWPATAALYA